MRSALASALRPTVTFRRSNVARSTATVARAVTGFAGWSSLAVLATRAAWAIAISHDFSLLQSKFKQKWPPRKVAIFIN
jgi:hypothetical protein